MSTLDPRSSARILLIVATFGLVGCGGVAPAPTETVAVRVDDRAIVSALASALPPLPDDPRVATREPAGAGRAHDAAVAPPLEAGAALDASSATRVELPGFVLMLPNDEAGLLAPYVAPLLARGRAHFAARYGVEISRPILVEMHADVARYRARIGRRLGFDVDGATSGLTIVLLSPGAGAGNWGRTLWHELAHVFQGEASGGRAATSLLEGLAELDTRRERASWARPPQAGLGRVVDGTTQGAWARLESLFERPRSDAEIGAAYLAATEFAELLETRVGEAGIRAMMRAYAEGATDELALEAAGAGGLESVERAFLGRLEALDAERGPSLPSLQLSEAERAGCGSEACSAAERAARALCARDLDEAERQAEQALVHDPAQPRALYVLGRVELLRGDPAAEARWLALLRAGVDTYELRIGLGRVSLLRGELARAREHVVRALVLDAGRVQGWDLALQLADRGVQGFELDLARRKVFERDPHAGELGLARLRAAAERADWATVDALASEVVFALPASEELHRHWLRAARELGRSDVVERESAVLAQWSTRAQGAARR